VASAAVRGALRRALELGRSAAHARDARDLAARLGGQLFAAGRVLDVVRSGALGSALVEPAQDAGSTLRIEFETEYLLAALDGRIVGATPDLIVVVNGHTLAPIQCEDLRRGDPVGVIGLDGPPEWYAPEALALASPAAWGYGS
jgi:DUF917 family protein